MAKKRSSRAISVAASSMKARKTRKLTSKILKEAYAQQKEVENENQAEEFPMTSVFNQAVDYGCEEEFTDDDVDELSEFHNQLAYQDVTNEEEEDKLLDALFNKDGASIAKRLCDAITTSRKEELQDKEDDDTTLMLSKAIDFFQSLGKFISVYTQGKLPKAFTLVTRRENWDSLLMLTQPENWSPNAMYKVTNMFASASIDKAERFYRLFLLPRVRKDIKTNKNLHFCLYESLKKALFKPEAFFKGILIPLCEPGTCTLSEAVIIGSVMQKVSIPEKFSSTALVCLAKMTFGGTTSYFMKVILEKNYALANGAVNAVTTYFLMFQKEKTVMPVIWHQTLLAFVQRYKHEIRKEDKKRLRNLLDKQHHKLITPEIVRELDNSRNRGEKFSDSPSACTIIKPIKEDIFDMPQVPMEED